MRDLVLRSRTYDGPDIHVDSRLTVTTASGVALPDLVTVPGQRMVSPTVADLDGNGKTEIIVFTVPFNSVQTGWLRVYDHEGNPLPGWPLVLQSPYGFDDAPVVGDLDDDGDLEIVFNTYLDRVYAWHHDATPLPGWPLVDPAGHGVGAMQPLIGDADGDPGIEVVLFTEGCYIEAYEMNGQPSPGYPIATTSVSGGDPCWINEAVMGRVGGSTRLAYGLARQNPNKVRIRWVGVPYDADRAHWPVILHNNHRTSEHRSP